MDFTIRLAEEKDIPKLFEIERTAYGAESYPYFVFIQALDALGDLFFVAEHQVTGVLGFILGALQSGRKDGWVLDLAVQPNERRSGVGQRLASVLIDTSFKKGADKLYLHVDPSNTGAIGLYEGLGFVTIQEIPNYFGHGADRRIMCLDRSGKQQGD